MDDWTRTGLVGIDCPPRELVYPPKGVNKTKIDKALCSKTVHEMHLADEPFDQIVSGKKTVEVRLNDEKRREISVGVSSYSFAKVASPICSRQPLPT